MKDIQDFLKDDRDRRLFFRFQFKEFRLNRISITNFQLMKNKSFEQEFINL